MSTTSIRLPDQLKQRIARAAEHSGLTPHAFMVEAIAERVESEERRRDFQATTEQRYARILDAGETIPWPAMLAYLKRRVAGEAATPPEPIEHKQH